MSGSQKRKNTASPAKYAIAAAVALLAGFGTVYWLSTPSDNRSGPADRGERTPAPATGAANAGSSPLKGLNTGAMAAFVVRPRPADVPTFAFEGAGGVEQTAADLKGKVVLLNIWATWCVPCREEMPQLNTLQSELGGSDFEVVAINIDKGGPDKAKAFLAETGASDLTPYFDPTGKLFARLKAVGMPTTLLLNADGQEMGRLVGPADWASPEAKAIIEAALGAARDGTP
ncbi:MAG: thiol:disulfide interchange protein TlpA [Methyloceanibacter sp.]|nr:MAG: thiol:disulfide interchange protein TlpA [Methyloceanibacter sp.]